MVTPSLIKESDNWNPIAPSPIIEILFPERLLPNSSLSSFIVAMLVRFVLDQGIISAKDNLSVASA